MYIPKFTQKLWSFSYSTKTKMITLILTQTPTLTLLPGGINLVEYTGYLIKYNLHKINISQQYNTSIYWFSFTICQILFIIFYSLGYLFILQG